ncbi:Rv1535 domain-containing protein [Mycobacterium sp. 1274756.6]|uniref:Rv1535 domain-containing protein n=1 Tax=Mycobacterium sp. 1274756.6 TaxID=1834076 RepID=UPI00336A8540
MATTDLPADRAVLTIAEILTVPLQHAYALLWRAGVMRVDRPARSAAAPPRQHPQPPRPSRGPAPTRWVPAEYSRGTG